MPAPHLKWVSLHNARVEASHRTAEWQFRLTCVLIFWIWVSAIYERNGPRGEQREHRPMFGVVCFVHFEHSEDVRWALGQGGRVAVSLGGTATKRWLRPGHTSAPALVDCRYLRRAESRVAHLPLSRLPTGNTERSSPAEFSRTREVSALDSFGVHDWQRCAVIGARLADAVPTPADNPIVLRERAEPSEIRAERTCSVQHDLRERAMPRANLCSVRVKQSRCRTPTENRPLLRERTRFWAVRDHLRKVLVQPD